MFNQMVHTYDTGVLKGYALPKGEVTISGLKISIKYNMPFSHKTFDNIAKFANYQI